MDQKIKCIDCHWSSFDPGFCICTRSYKVRDPERLHYCRKFCKNMKKGTSPEVTDVLEFINGIIKESESKR